MKRNKKFAGLLLAMTMALGMTMTSFATEPVTPESSTVQEQEPIAEADPTYQLTIKTVKNHTYTIYQLATGDVSTDDGETRLSNIAVGANANASVTVADIQALKDKSGSELGDAALALINVESALVVNPVKGDGTDIKVTLPGGYYVVTDAYTSNHEHSDECYDDEGDLTCGIQLQPDGDSISRTVVMLIKDETMTPKTITVEPDKKIKEDNTGKDTNEASIGDVITYQLSGTIPDMTGYNAFKYVLVDTASKGLVQNVKEGDTLTGGLGTKDETTNLVVPESNKKVQYKVTGKSEAHTHDENCYNESEELICTKEERDTTEIRVAVVDAINYKDEVGKWFYVDIEATLTEDADVVAIPNTNKVKIDFSNNPNHEYDGEPDFGPNDPHGTTVDVTVETFTTSLTLNKVDGETNVPLVGAEFKLESTNSANVGYVTGQEYVPDESGTWYKLADGAYTEIAPTEETANKYASKTDKYALKDVDKTTYEGAQTSAQAFVDKDGKVVFTGLGVGDYTLTEVTTPDGYNTLPEINFSVTWTKDGGFKVVLDDSAPEGITISDENQLLSSTIPNNKGSLLPSTGGIGTTIFYVVGGILVIGAGILLVTKKRMSSK